MPGAEMRGSHEGARAPAAPAAGRDGTRAGAERLQAHPERDAEIEQRLLGHEAARRRHRADLR